MKNQEGNSHLIPPHQTWIPLADSMARTGKNKKKKDIFLKNLLCFTDNYFYK